MFQALIAEARKLCRRKAADLDERPEVSVANEKSFPRRGTEKTAPYGEPGIGQQRANSLGPASRRY